MWLHLKYSSMLLAKLVTNLKYLKFFIQFLETGSAFTKSANHPQTSLNRFSLDHGAFLMFRLSKLSTMKTLDLRRFSKTCV